jgi:hypothetical protein
MIFTPVRIVITSPPLGRLSESAGELLPVERCAILASCRSKQSLEHFSTIVRHFLSSDLIVRILVEMFEQLLPARRPLALLRRRPRRREERCARSD